MKKAFLFDLDGTLLDTAPDLVRALNIQLKQYNRPEVSYDIAREWCAMGSKGLITGSFGIDDQHEDYPALRAEYLEVYFENIFEQTKFFDGVMETLTWIANENLLWGIVTNKPTDLTHQLLKYIDFPKDPDVIVCADTLPVRKPHPDPIFYALEQIGCTVEETLFVGDTISDLLASEAAGMDMLYVDYGYEILKDLKHAKAASSETLLDMCQINT